MFAGTHAKVTLTTVSRGSVWILSRTAGAALAATSAAHLVRLRATAGERVREEVKRMRSWVDGPDKELGVLGAAWSLVSELFFVDVDGGCSCF